MSRILLTLFLFLPDFAYAADPWSDQDKALEAAFLTLVVIDWGQTLDIENHPSLHEANPVMGSHPSRSRINMLMPLGMLLHVGIVHYLPEKWRPYFQYITLIAEAGAVHTNYKAGLALAF